MAKLNRRNFLTASSLAGAGGWLSGNLTTPVLGQGSGRTAGTRPLVISSSNGMKASAKAMEMIKSGSDTLEAVIAGVTIVEDDPSDHSVGYGGLPNEDGEVELDASVIHGPTARCGAVGGIRNIRNPSQVARLVMERTDHIFLVGEGALKFALAHGFKKEDLLTEESRQIWLRWKENRSNTDFWLPPEKQTAQDKRLAEVFATHGTIHCSAINANGDISAVTTTSGMSWKLSGRVGDSPIIGAGTYVDNEIGAAGSTGRGEANIKICGAHTVVELLRQGKSPEEACLEACRRVIKTTTEKRLLDANGRPNFDISFYALNKKGEYGGAALYSGFQFCVNDGGAASKLVDAAYLFKREPRRTGQPE